MHPAEILDPKIISHVLISPRTRAQKTYELLFAGLSQEKHPQNVVTDERVREWTYGAYEGALAKDVNAERAKNGQPKWDIVSASDSRLWMQSDGHPQQWQEGCPDGESAQEMEARADEVVNYVKSIHKEWMRRPNGQEADQGGDVLILSHGHFSRVRLAARTDDDILISLSRSLLHAG
jgi:probable phosphoglycerate mutase